MKMNEAVTSLAALAQASRLAAYRLLVQAGQGGLTVGEIGTRLKLPGATLNSHLNVLRRAGLVRDTREGRSIRCRADYARMDALLAYLTENCCGNDTPSPARIRGEPCAPVCAPTRRKRP